ncbi:unnamed protein product, partial [Dicrocoelium dendriticum]
MFIHTEFKQFAVIKRQVVQFIRMISLRVPYNRLKKFTIVREAYQLSLMSRNFTSIFGAVVLEIQTDHKLLMSFLDESKEIQQMYSPRMQRWTLILSAHEYKTCYIPGPNHCTADALSRLLHATPAGSIEAPVKLVPLMQYLDSTPLKSDVICRWTDQVPNPALVIRSTKLDWPSRIPADLKPFGLRRHELNIQDGCLFWGSRLIPLSKVCPFILNELHNGHPDVARMMAIARRT